MKYAIIETVNGAFFVRAEGYTNLASAKVFFHGRCQTLWNAQEVLSAYVMIVDENLDVVEGYKEYIHHGGVQTTPEPTPEPDVEPEG